MSESPDEKFLGRLKNVVLGGARDIRDPNLFHKLSLVAFFAWVGLGADGLSSANYGPEESFLSLGAHGHLGIFVALATAVTIFVIASSYSQIVELLPVRRRRVPGGQQAPLPDPRDDLGVRAAHRLRAHDHDLRSPAEPMRSSASCRSPCSHGSSCLAVVGVLILTLMNLRGVQESVAPLVPIFLLFLVTHTFAILFALVSTLPEMGAAIRPRLSRPVPPPPSSVRSASSSSSCARTAWARARTRASRR